MAENIIVIAAKSPGRWVLISIGAILVLSIIVISIHLIDQPVIVFLRAEQDPSVVMVAALLNEIGNPTPYFVTSGLAFIYFRLERVDAVKANISLFILLCSTTPPIWADILKLLFGRSRPRLLLEKSIYAFQPFSSGLDFRSFPSEHACVAGAMATALSILFPAYRPTFILLAVIVMASRVVVGAHYPSDVIAGMSLGVATVLVIKYIFDRYGIELRQPRRRWP